MFCKIIAVIPSDDGNEKTTVLFAAEELRRYLKTVLTDELPIVVSKEYTGCENNTIAIGVKLRDFTGIDDPDTDDAVFIDVENFAGVITGTNPRAVLIGVYRFLREKGFRFIRPGKAGEVIPKNIDGKKVEISEKASYRHRAICIEGSVFKEQLIDIIDWLPKVSMNGYFIQFKLPKEFFDRWYTVDNPYRRSHPLTEEEILEIVHLMEREIQKRSLIYHAVGHGWTSSAVGLKGDSWGVYEGKLTKRQTSWLAMINGKRELYKNVPLNTNLCYSDPDVRNAVTDNIVEYCKEHPTVKYVHFWLADANNNNCECENCRKDRTSTYYVQMLNLLDEKLSAADIDTKIVFLIYYDLLWKPLHEKLHNKDRFVLMFAPITRSYSSALPCDTHGTLKPYVLNELEFPKSVEDNLAYLKDWQNDFAGDSFDFDYHYMWDHYYDFSYYNHAKILHQDICNLKNLGLNGLVSCQLQRVFLPTAMGMNVMADTLWNRDTAFDAAADDVLFYEFGEDHAKVKSYLHTLSLCNCAKVLRGEERLEDGDNYEDLDKAKAILKGFVPVIEKNIKTSDTELRKQAWDALMYHNRLYCMLIELYRNYGGKASDKRLEEIRELVLKNEFKYKDVFDGMYFLRTLEKRILKRLG